MKQLIMVTTTKAVYQDTEGTTRISDIKKDILGFLYFQHGKQVVKLPGIFQPKN